jgi:hypothetical protein
MLDKQADPARGNDRIHPQAVARAVSDPAKPDAVFTLDTGLNTLLQRLAAVKLVDVDEILFRIGARRSWRNLTESKGCHSRPAAAAGGKSGRGPPFQFDHFRCTSAARIESRASVSAAGPGFRQGQPIAHH